MLEEKKFLCVEDVAEYMSISIPTAYKIIHQLNSELKKNGYITVAGRISRKYFESKIYGEQTA